MHVPAAAVAIGAVVVFGAMNEPVNRNGISLKGKDRHIENK